MALSLGQRASAASAYRSLLRAQKITFKGDEFAVKAAYDQTRSLFGRFCPSLLASTSSQAQALKTEQEVDEHIQAAREIALYLRRNVVQGVQKDDGSFALRFTQETELGDNATIKQPKATEARVMRGPGACGGGEGEDVRDPNSRRRRRKTATAAAASAPAGAEASPA